MPFCKLRNTQSPGYLLQHIPPERVVEDYNLRNPDLLKPLKEPLAILILISKNIAKNETS